MTHHIPIVDDFLRRESDQREDGLRRAAFHPENSNRLKYKQNDLGSFVLHANGEAYLVDPGYYEGKATDHTLPLIDDQGPDVSGSSIT
ncbi:MAG: hypothetical protein ACQESR_31435, partial [Planctomycetota bacterium]